MASDRTTRFLFARIALAWSKWPLAAVAPVGALTDDQDSVVRCAFQPCPPGTSINAVVPLSAWGLVVFTGLGVAVYLWRSDAGILGRRVLPPVIVMLALLVATYAASFLAMLSECTSD